MRARASRHQMSSYAWNTTQTAATSASATSAGTTRATGNSNAQASAATKRPRPRVREMRSATPRTRGGRRRGRRRGAKAGIVSSSSWTCASVDLDREREEHDPGDHRQMEVGVDVAREGRCARRRSRSASSCWARIGKKSKYASQNDVATTRPRTAATITPASSSVLARAEADRDQRLADRDDHDQPVPLDEMRRFHRQPLRSMNSGPRKPTASAATQSAVLAAAVDEPGREDQRRADRGRRNDVAGSAPRSSGSPRAASAYSAQVHDVDDEECDAE